jgi:hypothetical protein
MISNCVFLRPTTSIISEDIKLKRCCGFLLFELLIKMGTLLASSVLFECHHKTAE